MNILHENGNQRAIQSKLSRTTAFEICSIRIRNDKSELSIENIKATNRSTDVNRANLFCHSARQFSGRNYSYQCPRTRRW